MDDRLAIILEECIDSLESGSASLEDCLQRYPQYSLELNEMLRAAGAVRAAAAVTPRAAFRRSARARLVARLADRTPVTFWEVIRLFKQTNFPVVSRRFAMTWIAIAVLLASLFGGGGYAVHASNNALPGDMLYSLKTTIEDTRLALSQGDAVVDLYLEFGGRRLDEANRLMESASFDQVPEVLAAYWETVSMVAPQVSYTRKDASQESVAKTNLFSQQIQTMTGLVDQLPASQQETFQKAIGLFEEEPVDPVDPTDPIEDPIDDDPIEDPEEEGICVTGTLHPVGMSLSLRYETPYEDIMTWFCDGFGFGEIMLALQTSQVTEMTPEELLLLKVELGGWGEVWQHLGLIEPDDDPIEDPEEGEEEEGDELAIEGFYCQEGNTSQHPAGLRLATQYGVTYEEVMNWFCQEQFGMGQIMLALQTGLTTGLTPEEVLAMRTEQGGWGQVWQSLGLIGKNKKVTDPIEDPGEGEETEVSPQQGPPTGQGKPAGTPGGQPADKGKPADTPGGPPVDKGKPENLPQPPKNPGRP